MPLNRAICPERELRFLKVFLLDFRPHLKKKIKTHELSSWTLPEYFMCFVLYLLHISSQCAYYSSIPNRWLQVLHIIALREELGKQVSQGLKYFTAYKSWKMFNNSTLIKKKTFKCKHKNIKYRYWISWLFTTKWILSSKRCLSYTVSDYKLN